MENFHLLAVGHLWQAAIVIVIGIAGAGFRRYGRMLERQTREQSGRRSL